MMYIHTYLTGLLNPVCQDLRPCTRSLHSFLFSAKVSAVFRFKSSFSSSLESCCLQVIFGLPRFLVPCGFQLKACFVMSSAGFRKVCPNHLNFFFLICKERASWLVLSHRFLLLIVCGQKIFSILLRHLFRKTCNLFSRVFERNHVSDPYKRIVF